MITIRKTQIIPYTLVTCGYVIDNSAADFCRRQSMIDWDELTGQCNMRAKFLVVVLIECGGLYTENGLSAQPLCAITA